MQRPQHRQLDPFQCGWRAVGTGGELEAVRKEGEEGGALAGEENSLLSAVGWELQRRRVGGARQAPGVAGTVRCGQLGARVRVGIHEDKLNE